ESSFSTESGNKNSFTSENNKLVQQSYDEKRLAVGLGAVGLVGVGIAGLLRVLGIFGKDKSKTSEGASHVNVTEPTVFFGLNPLGINEENIAEVVENVTKNGKKLKIVESFRRESRLLEVKGEYIDSFFILKGHYGDGSGTFDLIVRLLNEKSPYYNERRKFYDDNFENFNKVGINCQNTYGIYKNAVIMTVCTCSRDCVDGEGKEGCGFKIPESSRGNQFLVDEDKAYYDYEHHNHESDEVRKNLDGLPKIIKFS
ncbi:MAG: hypothetical protein FWC41_04120, partial [Firmicutes bacterium]|nr:hypothetical protein [Bacillota bacterium]